MHDGTPVPSAAPALRTLTVFPRPSPTPQPGVTPQPTPPVAQPSLAQARKPEGEQDPLVGRQIGEYVVRQCIGSGGMGIVYEGEHTTIGRKVAIKLIREEHAKSPHARDLLTEARAASAIRHHGIIDVHGFGHQPDVGQYLVMEYLEGRPLNALIRERAPLPPSEALPLLCEVLDALSAAHAVGVIHRDLKPSNIFVVRQSNGSEYIKVLDFGLAKRSSAPDGTSEQTHSGLLVGTPQYMSPEQSLGEPVSPQSDLYAVGIIAFELLTGQRPFSGRSHMEVVCHHLKTPAPSPSSLVPLPPEIDDLVLRLLAKEPRQRPASASEVVREMRARLQSQRSASVPVPRAISRPIPAVKSVDAAPLNAPTETLSPSPATPSPVMPGSGQGASPQPPTRRSRRAWAAVVGGSLTLTLGVGALVNREPAESAQTPDPLPPVTVAPTATQPEASTPEPQPPPTPAPMLMGHSKPAVTSSLPAKKKPPRPVRQPVSSAARQPPPAVLAPAREPAPQVVPERAPERSATGTLHLMVKGAWADVWVDGQKLGRVPPQNRYPLTAGEHALELRNPNRAPYRGKIVIPPSNTLSHTVDFTATPQAASSSTP
ncbi:protein kinase [Archangium violaceum]|uniref:serine/threonine-protein kinase n=1 Tax=Archangium violaceum TaxID=83451 RepID=UPI0037BE41DA